MKIRLVKKIMKAKTYMIKQAIAYPSFREIPILPYWSEKWLMYKGWNAMQVSFSDHRITKAISLTRKRGKHED